MGDLPSQELGVGDVVTILAMCRQRIKNVGRDDLVFLVICSPQFTGDAYEDLEGVSDTVDKTITRCGERD